MIPPGQQDSNFTLQQNHLEDLLKYRFLGSNSRVYGSVDLEQDSKIYISNKFLGDVHAAGLRMNSGTTTLENAAEICVLGLLCQSSEIHADGPVHGMTVRVTALSLWEKWGWTNNPQNLSKLLVKIKVVVQNRIHCKILNSYQYQARKVMTWRPYNVGEVGVAGRGKFLCLRLF